MGTAHYLKAKLAKDLPDTLRSSLKLLAHIEIILKNAIERLRNSPDHELKSKLLFNRALILQLREYLGPTEKNKKDAFTQSRAFTSPMGKAYALNPQLRIAIPIALKQTADDALLEPAVILPRSISKLDFPPFQGDLPAAQLSPTPPKGGAASGTWVPATTLEAVFAPRFQAQSFVTPSLNVTPKRLPETHLEHDIVKRIRVKDLTSPTQSSQSPSPSMINGSEGNTGFSVQTGLQSIADRLRQIGESLTDCTKAFEQVCTEFQVLQTKIENQRTE